MPQRCIATARAIMSSFVAAWTQALPPLRPGPTHGPRRRSDTIIRLIYPRLAANRRADVEEGGDSRHGNGYLRHDSGASGDVLGGTSRRPGCGSSSTLRNLTRRPAFCCVEEKPCGMNEVDESVAAIVAATGPCKMR